MLDKIPEPKKTSSSSEDKTKLLESSQECPEGLEDLEVRMNDRYIYKLCA